MSAKVIGKSDVLSEIVFVPNLIKERTDLMAWTSCILDFVSCAVAELMTFLCVVDKMCVLPPAKVRLHL